MATSRLLSRLSRAATPTTLTPRGSAAAPRCCCSSYTSDDAHRQAAAAAAMATNKDFFGMDKVDSLVEQYEIAHEFLMSEF